jgi:hypothetical protein
VDILSTKYGHNLASNDKFLDAPGTFHAFKNLATLLCDKSLVFRLSGFEHGLFLSSASSVFTKRVLKENTGLKLHR